MMRYRRELTEYPTGSRRRVLVAVVVIACFISAYEGQLAPVLPLLLDDIGMSLKTYGLITAASLLCGALAGFVGGRLVDRVGRVRVIVPWMFLSAASCLFMAWSHTPGQFTAARILLAFVEGVAMSGTQPLIRDFTPRVGRAQAFAFWSWGSLGANFVAAGIAAATLDFFGTWHSQLYIMAGFAFVGSVLVMVFLQDLAPEVRQHTRHSDEHVEHRAADGPRPGAWALLQHRVVAAHVAAMSLMFVLLATMNTYAQKMLVDQLDVGVREASVVTMSFWAAALLGSLVWARKSDTTQARKPYLLSGGVAACACLAVLIAVTSSGADLPVWVVVVLFVALGGSVAATFGTWQASFSEHVEEIHPDAQGTAFGLQHMVSRLCILAAVLFAPRVVDATGGWRAWLVVCLVAVLAFTVITASISTRHRVRTPATVGAVTE